tara:strand:+ start:32512 stop:32850 length:339 start_codon:yes stop_codon:yes gene_type:complete
MPTNQHKYGLSAPILNGLIQEITKNSKVSKIVLFGSRAKGNYREGSDIDIALFGAEINTNDLLQMASDLENIIFPYQIDLVIFDRITAPKLKEHIERVGVELHPLTHQNILE